MSAIVLNDTEFPSGDLWVFGYGSLMWRPGFEFIERVPARLIGEHRALCVYSFVHREVKRSVWLENEARQRVSALVYVVDRGHVQYAGRLSPAEQLRHVLQGHGQSGVNRDYVLATVKAIEAEG